MTALRWVRILDSDKVALTCLRDEVPAHRDSVLDALQRLNGRGFLAEWEGQAVLCMIVERLRQAELLGALPQPALDEAITIERAYQSMTRRYLHEATVVCDKLQKDGVDTLVLKDLRAFQPPHTRPSYDLDLLVRRADRDRAVRCLAELGYERKETPLQDALLDRECGLTRYDGDLRFAIDLHWHILDRYRPRRHAIDPEALFEGRMEVKVDGCRLPGLSYEHLLLNFCVHTFEHELRFPSRLITWLDVAELIRVAQSRINWPRFVALVDRHEVRPEASIALRVARQLLNAPVPAELLVKVTPAYSTLGMEMSTFGYWNYIAKFLDDSARLDALRDEDSAVEVAHDALAQAKAVYKETSAVVDELANAARGPVAVHGEPSGMLVPSNRLPAVGRLELVLDSDSLTSLLQVLDSRGYRPTRGRLAVMRRRVLAEGHPLTIEFRIGTDCTSRLRGAPSIGRLLGALLGRPRRQRSLVVYVHPCSACDRVSFLLSRYSDNQAFDLEGLLYLADAVPAAGGATEDLMRSREGDARVGALLYLLDAFFDVHVSEGVASVQAASVGNWGVLEGLNRRTDRVEALSKYLVTQSGVRIVNLLLAPTWRLRLARTVSFVRRHGLGRLLRDLGFTLGRIRAGEGQRVPPRLYLTREGHHLTSLERTWP